MILDMSLILGCLFIEPVEYLTDNSVAMMKLTQDDSVSN